MAVKEFSDDVQIGRYAPQKLFQERLTNGLLNSCKGVPGHDECSTYSEWKNKHGLEAAIFKDDAHRKSRSMYVPVSKEVVVHRKIFQIVGEIKILDPPCQEKASLSSKHPYTCDNCYLQLRELKDTPRHRRSGSLVNKRNRLGLQGFNKRYAKKDEVSSALVVE